MITTLDSWEDANHRGDPQAAFEIFEQARRDLSDARHDEAVGMSLLVLPGDLGPAWEDPRHVGQPLYSTWRVPAIPPVPRKDSRSNERSVLGFTVVDLRDGGVQLHPPVRATPVSGSEGFPFTATSVRREVWEQEASAAGPSAAAVVLNRLVHGGSSVYCFLVDMDAASGRWYPYAMEGICPGQWLLAIEPGQSQQVFIVTVNEIGWDAEHRRADGSLQPVPFFTVVADPTTPLPPNGLKAGEGQTRILRKTFLDPFAVVGEDHTPNQSAGALWVDKHAYSDGDSFATAVHLSYQGDFMAAAGDEGGIGGSFELKQDVRVFSGNVEDFRMVPLDEKDPESPSVGQLTCYGSDSNFPPANVERIGAGRAIIDMGAGEITGACSLWSANTYRKGIPGYENGVIQIPKGSLPDVVGRFIAVDEPSERIDPNDSFCQRAPDRRLVPAHVLWRLFEITSLIWDPETTSQLLKVRYKLWDAYDGGVELVDTTHFATNSDPRPVRFVIRRGAIPFDVSRAVSENDQIGVARVMLMQPNADMVRGDPPFGSDNRVEQALGSRCWNPTGVRVRHANAWPSRSAGGVRFAPDASFAATNVGNATVGIGLLVDDFADGIDAAKARYRGGIGFETGVSITATTGTAISVSGDVAPFDRGSPRGADDPDRRVALLLNQKGATDDQKVAAGKAIGWTGAASDHLMTLRYDGVQDSFRIAGAGTVSLKGATTLDLGGARIINAGADVGAQRGSGAVKPGALGASGSVTARVELPAPLSDGYLVMVSPAWVTGFGVTKDTSGFTVQFEKAPPGTSASSFDWMVQPAG